MNIFPDFGKGVVLDFLKIDYKNLSVFKLFLEKYNVNNTFYILCEN